MRIIQELTNFIIGCGIGLARNISRIVTSKSIVEFIILTF